MHCAHHLADLGKGSMQVLMACSRWWWWTESDVLVTVVLNELFASIHVCFCLCFNLCFSAFFDLHCRAFTNIFIILLGITAHENAQKSRWFTKSQRNSAKIWTFSLNTRAFYGACIVLLHNACNKTQMCALMELCFEVILVDWRFTLKSKEIYSISCWILMIFSFKKFAC